MIQIIIDQDHCYEGQFDVYCHDAASYVQSRLLIDEVKQGDRRSISLILTAQMAKYFEDLRSIPGFVAWKNYAYQSLIDNYAPNLAADQMKELEAILFSKIEVIRFLKNCDFRQDMDENLRQYLLYNGGELHSLNSEAELWDWFETATYNKRTDWIERPIQKLFFQLMPGISQSLWKLLLGIRNEQDLELARMNVMATYLFHEYPPSSKNILHQKILFRDSMFFTPRLAESLFEQFPYLLEKINNAVFSCRNELSIFETEQFDLFLRRTQGYLDEEWCWVWNHILQVLPESNFVDTLTRVSVWVKTERPELNLMKQMFALLDLIDHDEIPKNWSEWAEFYTNTYLCWFPTLDRNKHIIEQLNRFDFQNEYILQLVNRISLYKEQKDRTYQDYLYRCFPELLVNDYTNTRLLKEMLPYLEQEKVFLLVIDGLRWEIWEVVKEILADQGYFLENNNQCCLSMLPSITSISRIALLGAKPYQTLLEEKRAGLYTHGVFDESRQIQRFYASRHLAFKIGGLDDLSDLMRQDADLYTFIYSQADHILHGAGDINRQALAAMLGEFIRELLQKIESKPGMLLAIATDHGSIKVTDKQQIALPATEELLIETHGNSVYLWSDKGDISLADLASKVDEEKWYILPEEQLLKYGLPLLDKNERKSVAWLFPRNQYYVGKKSGSYTHGGLSMQETIIPYGFFRKQHMTFQQLWLELGLQHIAVAENSFVEIIIFNPNPFTLKVVEINLMCIGQQELLQDFAPRSRKKVRYGFVTESVYCENGYFRDNLEIRIEYLNANARQTYPISIPVIIPAGQRSIQADVAAKRSLDF